MEQARRNLARGDSTANPFAPATAAPSGRPAASGVPVMLAPARPVRAPGTTFALGDSVESLVQRLALAPEGGDAATRTFVGTVRFFGQDAQAKLLFVERRLARVELETGPVSPRTRGFIADELTRQGYRRACRAWSQERSDCTWTGRTQVELQMDSTRVRARVALPAAAGPGAAIAGNLPPAPPAQPAAGTDTLARRPAD